MIFVFIGFSIWNRTSTSLYGYNIVTVYADIFTFLFLIFLSYFLLCISFTKTILFIIRKTYNQMSFGILMSIHSAEQQMVDKSTKKLFCSVSKPLTHEDSYSTPLLWFYDHAEHSWGGGVPFFQNIFPDLRSEWWLGTMLSNTAPSSLSFILITQFSGTFNLMWTFNCRTKDII